MCDRNIDNHYKKDDKISKEDFKEALKNFGKKLEENTIELDPEIAKVIHDNWDKLW